MSTLKKDVQTGRLLIIDKDNPPDITAEELLQYIHEGFVPVIKTDSGNEVHGNEVQFDISGYSVNAETGEVLISTIIFDSENTEESPMMPDTPLDGK